MHQAGKGEQHEQGDAQKDVQLVCQPDRLDTRRGHQRPEGDDLLRPVGQQYHLRAIHVCCGHINGKQAK